MNLAKQTTPTPTQAARSVHWETLAPGFRDPVHDSQTTFRVLLDALSRPGRLFQLQLAQTLDIGSTATPVAALAALYALCDFATPVWLATPNETLASALRFHTGASLAESAAEAAFAWIDDASSLPQLSNFALGDAESPEFSATVLIRVASLTDGPLLRCSGPGIETTQHLAPLGLPPGFWADRAELAAMFPCGIDLFLICGDTLAGVPRTTRVEEL
jgi:alpha-D-ribose 1-methylphosphonate 5-triphosphate synthase subunit PhnH